MQFTERRLVLYVAALAVLVSATSACGGDGDANAAPKDRPLATYTGAGLSFSHPTTWKAYTPIQPTVALHFDPLVYLSTQPVHAPCSTQGNTTSCGFPIDHLRPGDVLIMWEKNGLPALGLGPGTRLTVGGRLASRQDKTGGQCRTLGADRTIDVAVATSALPSALTYFTACIRGPDLAQAEQSVDALLASTTFAAPSS